LVNLKKYLNQVDLPYCNETDIKTLSNLATKIFDEVINIQKQRNMISIIEILRKRCASLNQWFELVINQVIVVDYLMAKENFDLKSKLLKMERIKLMQDRIKVQTGQTVQINTLKYNEINDISYNSSYIFEVSMVFENMSLYLS
jgi:hypothetical protein